MGVLPGRTGGDGPSSQDDGSSERQLARVSCALVVIVRVLRRVACKRLIDRNTLPQNTYAELIRAKKNCSCINK